MAEPTLDQQLDALMSRTDEIIHRLNDTMDEFRETIQDWTRLGLLAAKAEPERAAEIDALVQILRTALAGIPRIKGVTER